MDLGRFTSVNRNYDLDGNISAINTAADTINFGVDNASRIASITDSGTAANTWSIIGYDYLDRLTGATKTSASYGWT